MYVGCESTGGTWDESYLKNPISPMLSFVCKQVQNDWLSRNNLGETAILSVLYIRAPWCKRNVRLEPQGVK